MDRHEYESRLRALDQRLESSIETLRAAHRVERPALDYLYRVLQGLVWGNVLAVVDRGGGRNPVRYRRPEEDDDAEPGGDGAAGE